MSFHPNDVARRARAATVLSTMIMLALVVAFFRTQILRNQEWALQSEENRLREVPIAAPRGIIYDRNGKIIAENIVGYSVSVLAESEDSLRATMARLAGAIPLSQPQMDLAVRRYKRAPTRPTVIINDAPYDVVAVLEEHRVDFPNLIILSSPKRFYPEGPAVAAFIGYTGEINERELLQEEYAEYKAGQQIGKRGLEKQYESVLHGREGSRFVEVDARGRIVREQGAQERPPEQTGSLQTNIDLDLQVYTASLFADSLVGGAVVMDPKTGAVLALHSAPSYDPNRFIGGVSTAYYDSLQKNPNLPMYNKVIQGVYPPGSTFKLVTAVLGLQEGLITPDSRMPQTCNGFYYFGNRPWRCWQPGGHGALDLVGAIAQSCNVYFYQLGLKVGLSRLVAGGVHFGFSSKAGIDVPEELRPRFPDALSYFDQRYPGGWTQGAQALNLSIGQGDNAQTILNMARFYAALATDGTAPTPTIATRANPERKQLFNLSTDHLADVRRGMIGVTSAGGTAASAALSGGITLAGKTGTAQTVSLSRGSACDHAWFVGYAPADDPKVVVSVILECGAHGYAAARVASAIVGKHLGVTPMLMMQTGG